MSGARYGGDADRVKPIAGGVRIAIFVKKREDPSNQCKKCAERRDQDGDVYTHRLAKGS